MRSTSRMTTGSASSSAVVKITRTPDRRRRGEAADVRSVEDDRHVGPQPQVQPLERAEQAFALHRGLVVVPARHRHVVAVDDELDAPSPEHPVERVGAVGTHPGRARNALPLRRSPRRRLARPVDRAPREPPVSAASRAARRSASRAASPSARTSSSDSPERGAGRASRWADCSRRRARSSASATRARSDARWSRVSASARDSSARAATSSASCRRRPASSTARSAFISFSRRARRSSRSCASSRSISRWAASPCVLRTAARLVERRELGVARLGVVLTLLLAALTVERGAGEPETELPPNRACREQRRRQHREVRSLGRVLDPPSRDVGCPIGEHGLDLRTRHELVRDSVTERSVDLERPPQLLTSRSTAQTLRIEAREWTEDVGEVALVAGQRARRGVEQRCEQRLADRDPDRVDRRQGPSTPAGASTGSTSIAAPDAPHQRHSISSTRSARSSRSSISSAPPTLKWWYSRVRRVTVMSKRVRLPQAVHR